VNLRKKESKKEKETEGERETMAGNFVGFFENALLYAKLGDISMVITSAQLSIIVIHP